MTKAREAIARALNPMEWDDPGPSREDAVREDGYREANSVITALREAGLRIVPEEPTEAMVEASWCATVECSPENHLAAQLGTSRDAHAIKTRQRYKAMISAYEDGK